MKHAKNIKKLCRHVHQVSFVFLKTHIPSDKTQETSNPAVVK